MASIEARGPRQIFQAMRYSLQGLRSAWKVESSFRMEVYVFSVLAPLALWLGDNGIERALLFAVLVLVLVAELLNGAVEAIVDKTTPEYNELAGRSKDMGSAAVLLSLLLAGGIWLAALYTHFIQP